MHEAGPSCALCEGALDGARTVLRIERPAGGEGDTVIAVCERCSGIVDSLLGLRSRVVLADRRGAP